MREIPQCYQDFIGYILILPLAPIGSVLYSYLVGRLSHLYMTRFKPQLVPRVHKNLSLITRLPENDNQVAEYTSRLCQNLIYSYIEFFLDLGKGVRGFRRKVRVELHGLERIRQEAARGRGVVLAATHTCGFDHAICSIHHLLPGVQVLSKANPTRGNRFMCFLRKLHKIHITPITVPSLREAVRRLRSGGVVGVAIDLPVPNGDCYKFFGVNCCLTNAHTRLAVKSGALIFLVYSLRTPSGRYQVMLQEVKQPENCSSRKDLVTVWAQLSYRQVERFILQWPDAWYGSTFDLFSHSAVG